VKYLFILFLGVLFVIADSNKVEQIQKLQSSVEKKEIKVEEIESLIEKHQKKVDSKEKWHWWSWARLKTLKFNKWRLIKTIKYQREKRERLLNDLALEEIENANNDLKNGPRVSNERLEANPNINNKKRDEERSSEEEIIFQNAKSFNLIQSCLVQVENGETKLKVRGRQADYSCITEDRPEGYRFSHLRKYRLSKQRDIFIIEAKIKLDYPDGDEEYIKPRINKGLECAKNFYSRHGF